MYGWKTNVTGQKRKESKKKKKKDTAKRRKVNKVLTKTRGMEEELKGEIRGERIDLKNIKVAEVIEVLLEYPPAG